MRLVFKPHTADEVVLPIDRLRDRLEERLMTALESWEIEKKKLQEVLARAEAKEREFREVADDVKKRLDALDLVTGMAREAESEWSAERTLPNAETWAMLAAAPKNGGPIGDGPGIPSGKPPVAEQEPDGMAMHASSRPLFTPEQRARAGALSILP